MFRSKFCGLLALMVGVLSRPAAPADGSHWVALVSAVQGPVHYVDDGQDVTVHTLSKIPDHARLTVEEGAFVTLAFLQGGKQVTLRGRADTTVSDAGVDPATRQQATSRTCPAAILPDSSNLDRLGRPGARRIEAPQLGYIDSPPTLHFPNLSQPDVTAVDLEMRTQDDRHVSLRLPGQFDRFTLDAENMSHYADASNPYTPIAIVPGQRYLVDVTARHGHGPDVGATFVVRVLTRPEAETLRRATTVARKDAYNSDPHDPMSYAWLSTLYEDKNSYQAAMDELHQLARQYSDDADYLAELEEGVSVDLEDAWTQAVRAHNAKAFEAASW